MVFSGTAVLVLRNYINILYMNINTFTRKSAVYVTNLERTAGKVKVCRMFEEELLIAFWPKKKIICLYIWNTFDEYRLINSNGRWRKEGS